VTTRFAPTPSGYLHRGNAVNALVVADLARDRGLPLVLRIDDADGARCRPQYVDDIFDVLDWLGVRPDTGPKDRADLDRRFSQRLRTAQYRAEVLAARDRGAHVYACTCSRADAARSAADGCVRGCATQQHPWEPHRSALRIVLPGVTPDPVVWRRDDVPAYHLTSVVDDRDVATRLVVRGEDLREASALQVALAPLLGADAFPTAEFVHHPLLTDGRGAKLSKSTMAAGPLPRTVRERRAIEDAAEGILAALRPPSAGSPSPGQMDERARASAATDPFVPESGRNGA
jgi:glutamyl-tRNA synthetase